MRNRFFVRRVIGVIVLSLISLVTYINPFIGGSLNVHAVEKVTYVMISLPSEKILAGHTITLKVTCYDRYNHLVSDVNENDLTWSIADGYDQSVVTLLNKSGSVLNVRCNKTGNILLQVRHTDGAFNAGYFSIHSETCEKIASFTASDTEITLSSGQTKSIETIARDPLGNRILELEITVKQYDCNNIAKIDVNGMNIVITGKSKGTCSVTIAIADCPEFHAELTINVVDICDTITGLTAEPSEIITNKGQSKKIGIVARDESGNKLQDIKLEVLNICPYIASVEITGTDIKVTGQAFGTCSVTISVLGCPDVFTMLSISVIEPPCFKIKESKVSGIININQQSTTIGAITLEKCSKGSFDVDVVSSDPYAEVVVKTSTDQAINYGVIVNSGFLSANKCYSASITFTAGSIKKVVPVYYYTFDSRLTQTRPTGCTGWTGMGSNASRSNSVPLADAPGSLNPSLVWSSLDYEVESNKHSPVIWNNRLIKMYELASDKGVECYDLASKNLLWRTDDLASGSENFRGPSIYKNYVFITINSKIIALDANDGSEIWSWSEYGEVVAGNPVISNDRVFSGGNKLRCHDLSTGYVLWEKESTNKYFSDLTIQSGVLCVIARSTSYGNISMMYTYDCVTGKNLWSKYIDEPDLVSVFGQDSILLRYFDDDSNRLECHSSKISKLKWSFEIPGETEWYSIPAIYDIYIILLNGKSVYCIDSRNGNIIWENETQEQITNVPVIAGNRVYVCIADKGIYTYDLRSGKILANPFKTEPQDLYEWIEVIPAEGTLIGIYSSGYNSIELCCYANNGRFKRIKVSALEMTVNSKTISRNNYNTYKSSTIAVAPQIFNGVVCIPVKNVLDIFGGKLTKTGTKSYKITFGSKTLELTVDKPKAVVNGKTVQIDPKNAKIVPKEVSGVLLVPASFFATSVGLTNFWDNQTKTVIYLYQQIY